MLLPHMQPDSAARRLERSWWRTQPSLWQWCLSPVALLYGGLMSLRSLCYRYGLSRQVRLPIPVVVVGNYIVGGAGKTPTTLALVHAFKAQGWRPGVVSRGYGREGDKVTLIHPDSKADAVGDEPLLIFLKAQVPVCVGRSRAEAATALMEAHPEVNLIILDDGLQHLRLARDAQIVVFDQRGAGNGWTLPAGPLRERMPPEVPAATWVVYNAPAPSTPLAGTTAERQLAGAVELEAWRRGQAFSMTSLEALRQHTQASPALAAAGLAEPERFFSMLEAAGFQLERMPLPDHAPLKTRPWSSEVGMVLVTEKDAVKLQVEPALDAKIWVLGLDFTLPAALTQALDKHLRTLYPTIAP
ncbi:MAG: tetraacyldisaccharide 4'-kinase [Ideonella sp.]|nr:tetraacyldisaccharide 4'-kinase [Ideonella sp.]